MSKSSNVKFKTVEEYIESLPIKARKIAKSLRELIKQIVPEVEEQISYNMPVFKFHGILLYFAGHKEHIGFYPGNASLINSLKDDLHNFETSKGTIKFPLDKPLPVSLIKRIVKIRVKENLERSRLKAKNK